MRFRAEISSTSHFTKLITSLAPLGKIATLKLKSDSVHLICRGEGGARGGAQVWRCASIFRSLFSPSSRAPAVRRTFRAEPTS